MLRQFIKLGHNLAHFNHAKSFTSIHLRLGILNRHFSSEMTATWPESIKRFLEKEKIDKPTLIQEKTLPIAMENKDLVGVARTGSGKTLAFAIPAIMKILNEKKHKVENLDDNPSQDFESDRSGRASNRILPTCLVMAPTRELASQTHDVFKKFRHLGIESVVLVGGASRSDQIRELTYNNHDVYIATPGRLIDLIETNTVDLSNIKFLVLDEADRMLDMGFEPQIRNIVSKIPENRQTLMWSATWPQEIQNLAEDFMKDYEYIAVDSEKLKANPNIKQIVEVCRYHDKLNKTLDYLQKFYNDIEKPRVLIFVNQKRMADQLLLQLMRNRRRAVAMHGDRSQRQRDDALKLFKNKACDILVATDVAARGLDINDITHVINYDFPNTIEDYIHRIGRTARHEKSGSSISYLTEENSNIARKLIQVLEETNQEVPEKLKELSHMQHMYRKPELRGRKIQNNFYSRGGSNSGYNRPSNNNRYNNRQDQRSNSRNENYNDEDEDDQFFRQDRRDRRKMLFEDYSL